MARARYRMADLLFEQGEFAQSNAMLEQCLQVFPRSRKTTAIAAETLNDIAGGLLEMGELSKARNMYEAALVGQRLVRSKRGIAEALTNLGSIGRARRTRRRQEIRRGSPRDCTTNLERRGLSQSIQNNMGDVLVEQGDLAASKSLCDQSLALRRELGNESDMAESMHNIAGALANRAMSPAPRRLYDETLAIQVNRGEQGNAAGTRLSKAELMVESGRPGRLRAALRSALEQFKKEKQVQEEVSAHATLAKTLLELGRLTEAKAEVVQATRLANRNESSKVRLKTQIVAAEVLSAEEAGCTPLGICDEPIKEAQKAGFFILQLEATLALAGD